MEELSLEERVLRLEGKLGWTTINFPLSRESRYSALLVSCLALGCSLKGLGLPNHYYQPALAVLTVVFGYHKSWIIKPREASEWVLALLNVLILAVLFKLLIGVGIVSPFSWLKYPVLTHSGVKPGGWTGAITGPISDLDLSWQPTAAALWTVDITVLQTFLFLISLLGSLIEFQPFVSFTAFLLLLVSIPALSQFDWPWVFPAMVLASIGLYLQSADNNLPGLKRKIEKEVDKTLIVVT